jgi:hypothetical protein
VMRIFVVQQESTSMRNAPPWSGTVPVEQHETHGTSGN